MWTFGLACVFATDNDLRVRTREGGSGVSAPSSATLPLTLAGTDPAGQGSSATPDTGSAALLDPDTGSPDTGEDAGCSGLFVTYDAGTEASSLVLSGEVTGGAVPVPWTELAEAFDAREVSWCFPAAQPSASFRFSVELAFGLATTWSCVWNGSGDPDDPANFVTTGDARVSLDGIPQEVTPWPSPTDDGCGLITTLSSARRSP